MLSHEVGGCRGSEERPPAAIRILHRHRKHCPTVMLPGAPPTYPYHLITTTLYTTTHRYPST